MKENKRFVICCIHIGVISLDCCLLGFTEGEVDSNVKVKLWGFWWIIGLGPKSVSLESIT